jgi:DNA-binding transcriptional LysR family regulator
LTTMREGGQSGLATEQASVSLRQTFRAMAKRLPPLNTLRLFEAAGRHLSFKLAAEELNLTPSGVSHGIQTLESWLGTPLFVRGVRGLTLTSAGEAYLPEVARVLDLLSAATEVVPGRRPSGRLTVSVAPTFASRWLLPRLPGFTAQHPSIAVTLDTDRRKISFRSNGVDLAIRMAPHPESDEAWVELLREELVPVCAPALLPTRGRSALDVLSTAPIIRVTSVSEDWPAWFQAIGHDPVGSERALLVDSIQLSIDAAVQGLGVVLGRRPLVDEEIADGRLVPLAPAVFGRTSYWLVGSAGTLNRPETRAFRSWLQSQLTPLSGRAELPGQANG